MEKGMGKNGVGRRTNEKKKTPQNSDVIKS